MKIKAVRIKKTLSRSLLCTVAVTLGVLSVPVPMAQAAPTTYPSDAKQPDVVALLSDYENYWKPSMSFDSSDASTFGVGKVVNKTVMEYNDKTAQQINNAAAAGSDGTTPTSQQKRALIDADYKMSETLPDALGPILGTYFSEGLTEGKLPKTSELIIKDGGALVSDYLSTGTAKTVFNHPRPFVDRTAAGYLEAKLQKTVGVKRVPVWTDAAGATHDAGYDGFLTSGSFPSGHTTYAMSGAIGLATILPQLGPEILARGSEASNNRIVLGLHYPLDIMGGRIDGEVANAARWSDEAFRTDKLLPAQKELADYLTSRCSTDGYGDTLDKCIAATGANDAGGYKNGFADVVSTNAVTDRDSAIAAYTSRLTYGFSQTGAKGQKAKVPGGAENLLITSFPTLTAEQRKQVLADTEIDSGYPLDASSQGYQRLNLAAAMSAKVTLAADGSVSKVEPGQKAPSVVKLTKDASQTDAATTSGASDVSGSSEAAQTSATTTGVDGKASASTVVSVPRGSEKKPVAGPKRLGANKASKKDSSQRASAESLNPVSASDDLAHTGSNVVPIIIVASVFAVAGMVALIVMAIRSKKQEKTVDKH